MALDYDFYVNSLGFNTRITAETPYERATAQFRKEQFDSTPTVGDQSLTGWWTRGQLSFHKGAGVNYYEVLEGETVLNRFKDCEGVRVFEPGEVTLSREMSALGLAAIDAVPGSLGGGGGVYVLTGSGVEHTSGAGTTPLATSDAAVPGAIATSGSLYYVTNGTKIERQYAASEARTNHVTNPSFETSITGWTTGGVGDSHSLDGSIAKYGTRSLEVNPDSTFGGAASHVLSGLTSGQVYKVSCWVYVRPFGGSASDNYGVSLTIDSEAATATTGTTFNEWVQLSGVFTATATSHTLRVATGSAGGGSGPYHPYFNLDAVLFTESPYTSDYFDGSQSGCAWEGTANASKSTYATSATGASVVRITSSDATWQDVWWAKGRIWAVDDTQYFYALADAVATVSKTDSFWNSKKESPTWSLTDSPGAVFISDGADIFAITVGTDGLLPTLTSPTTASRVPDGETIVDLTYCLSNLIVTTTRGVRIAVVQDDRIFLGPLSIEGDFSNTVAVANYDTIAYVAGRLEGRGGTVVLCALNLAQINDNLSCAWAPIKTLTDSASTSDGVTVDPAGRIFAWAAGETYVSSVDTCVASGSITTGYHRFGTLDDKHFASVSVRLRGAGQVKVYRVDDDETETLLSTLDAASAEGEVPLGTGGPTERIALKFVLDRDALDSTSGPTLLGYQLKALPLPKRQRMFRVPLLLFDKESNRNGQQMGTPGSAWTRLAALEALEESNAVVTFDDKETGETGSAYIESIEVRRSAPAGRQRASFGGLIYLTLRQI